MPTISSLGTMPPTLERRISESTPGAILQPQPPPCEKLVRRSGAAPGRAHSAEGSRLMARVRKRSVDCLSAPATAPAAGRRPASRTARRSRAGRNSGSRRAHCAPQARGERGVGDEAAHQRRQRRGVADRKEAVVVGTEQADVAVDPARQHRHARAHRLDHDVGAALHDARMDERARPRDRPPGGGMRQRRRASDSPDRPRPSPGPRRRAAGRARRRCGRGSARAPRRRAAGRRASASRDPSRRAGGRRRRTRDRPASAPRAPRSPTARSPPPWRASPHRAGRSASSCSTTTRLAHSSECRARGSWSRSR